MEIYSSIMTNKFINNVHYARKKDKKNKNEKYHVTFNLHLFISHDITHQHIYFIKSTRQISPYYTFPILYKYYPLSPLHQTHLTIL